MSGEQPTGQDTPAVSSEVPEQVAATDTTVTDSPETQTDEPSEKTEAKTFTQAEVDDLIKRNKAATESRTERRLIRALEKLQAPAAQTQQQQYFPADEPPPRRDNESDGDYIRRVVQTEIGKVEAKGQQNRQQTAAQQVVQANQKVVELATKLPGFDQDVFDDLPITEAMAAALRESPETGSKVVAYLTGKPEEADRIAKLSPARQIAEIGKLEEKLVSKPKTSKATPPINPVGSSGTSVKNLSTMSMEDFIKERQKAGSRWI